MADFNDRTQAVKYALALFNLLILIFSIVVVSSASVLLARTAGHPIHDLRQPIETPETTCIVLIIVGTLTLLLSLLGYYATVKESHQFLFAHGLVLLILFIIQLVCAIYIVDFLADLKDEENSAVDAFRDRELRYKWDNNSYDVVDHIQSNNECCGGYNFTEWNVIQPYSDTSAFFYPPSCCPPAHLLQPDRCLSLHMFTKPCSEEIKDHRKPSTWTLAVGVVTTLILQFLALVASCILGNSYRMGYDSV
ncbi:CD63 antigen [Halotydeus destructor]|nr:CD63 antigen [Halotydeus destructor]